jgi:NAD+ synthase (glutamine-hydrolysing)
MAEQSYREEMILVDESVFDQPPRERKEEPRMRRKFEAIVEGIKHMSLFTNAPLRFVIGLSGGIDSAVVAALLVTVCGKENVIAINMPSRYNSEATKSAAQQVAGNLGIEFLSLSVDAFVTPHEKLFATLDERYSPSDIARNLSDENIQAKARGTSILSNFASRYNRFFTNNGNKLEIALGYATLYGDVNGALAPIGDLTKTEVYEMAVFLNGEIFRKEVIPKNLIPDQLFSFDSSWIVPSAELKSNQIDPMKFGYHDALLDAVVGYLRQSPEDLLRKYQAGTLHQDLGIRRELMVRWGMDEPQAFVRDLEWFVSTIQKNVFKRIQSPPIIITSRSSYGYDIRESMLPVYWSPRYQELKKEVLAMKEYPKQRGVI